MRSRIARILGDTDWRDHLDRELVRKLEKLLKRVHAYEDAYRRAAKPHLAQLWVGLAELFYQQERLAARMRRIEAQQRAIIEGIEKSGIDDAELRETLDRY